MEYDVALECKTEKGEPSDEWAIMTSRHPLFSYANNTLEVWGDLTVRKDAEVTIVRKVLKPHPEPFAAEKEYLVDHPVSMTQDDLRAAIGISKDLLELGGVNVTGTLLNALATIQAQHAVITELENQLLNVAGGD